MSTIDKAKDEPLEDVYFFVMAQINRKSKEMVKRRFKETGIEITVDQWIVLKRIAEAEGSMQTDIARSTHKEPAAVTRMIDILCDKGYARRHPFPDDRRRHALYLTEGGRQLYQTGLPIVVSARRQGLNGLSETEQAAFRQTLNKILTNFN